MTLINIITQDGKYLICEATDPICKQHHIRVLPKPDNNHYWDADYDIHSITNEIIHGVEDDLDTGLGHTGDDDWNFTFHVT